MASEQTTPEIERALLDPTDVFPDPETVVRREDIPLETRYEILKRWEYDARELEVAEEENMPSDKPDLLGRILDAIRALGIDHDPDKDPPTKQGG